jgi:hypothetical protein
MFRADKVFHCTMKNQGRNQYGMAFFQKTSKKDVTMLQRKTMGKAFPTSLSFCN